MKRSGAEDSSVVGTGEAARRLGVSPPTLKRLIERGEIQAYMTGSEGGRGHYRIPVEEIERFKSKSEQRSLNSAITVLLVDDNFDSLQLTHELLKQDGFEVIPADSVAKALYILMNKQLKPSVVVTDLMMAEMDGRVLIQHLKGNPEWEHIPILVLSAYYYPNLDQEIAPWVKKVLHKPKDTLRIAEHVAEAIRHASGDETEKNRGR